MVPDWNDPFTLQSPLGSIDLNDPLGADGYFVLNREACEVGPTVRSEVDDVPQGDGSIPHDRWFTGTQMTLAIQLWQDANQPACNEQLTAMYDLLMMHQRALKNAGDNEGRVLWTPEGANRRMLDDVRLLEYARLTYDDGVPQVTFTVDTAFPYAIDLTEQNDDATDSVPITIINPGTADVWPVFVVDGTTSYFEITHDEFGLIFIYDATLPGGASIGPGNIAEVNTFKNTVYLGIGGLPGNDDNLKAGIDVQASDFFPLGVGTNTIMIVGSNMTVKWNPAWA